MSQKGHVLLGRVKVTGRSWPDAAPAIERAFERIKDALSAATSLAPGGVQFLVLATDEDLTAERVFTPDATLSGTDAGASSTYTLSRAALVGDVTAAAGSNTTTITANAVSDSKLRDSIATSVIGRSANSAGDPADIQASTVGHVLRLGSGPVLGFGLVPPSTVENHYLGTKALTNAAHIEIFDVAITTGQTCGGVVKTFIHVDDATDFEVEVAEHTYAGSNKAGTEAFTGPTTAIVTQHFTGAGAMAVVYSMLVGADKITFRVKATSSLGAPTTLTCRWELVELAGRTATVL